MPEGKRTVRISLLVLSYIFLIAYLLLLIKLIILKYLDLSDIMIRLRSDFSFRPYNLTPFNTIYSYYIYDSMPLLRRLGNVFGNIGIFMPIGLILPLISSRIKSFGKCILLVFCLSLVFEVMQFLLASGSADVDDLILNTIGGAIGYGIYIVLKRFIGDRNKVILISLALFLLMTAVGGWIIMKEFGLDLGIKRKDTSNKVVSVIHEQSISKDTVWMIPGRDEDVMGELVLIQDNILSLNKFTIMDIKEDEESQSYSKAMIITPHSKNNPVNKYLMSAQTIFIRKDVEQLSNTEFIVNYSKGYKDNIPLKATIQLWMMDEESMQVDTLCYWIKKH